MKTIKIGTSTDLTNQLSYAARGIVKGIELYINKINSCGGINGKLIEYIVLDDRNDSVLSKDNINRLLKQENVLALIGNSGGAKVEAAIPLVESEKGVLFGSFATSASLYKVPSYPGIFNFMANPGQITQQALQQLFELGINPNEIGFFTEKSIVGEFILAAAKSEYESVGFHSFKDLSQGSFPLNSTDIDPALEALKAAGRNLKAIIIGANAAVGLKFINQAKTNFPDAIFISINGFFCSDPTGATIIGNLYVPPLSENLPAVHEFNQDLAKNSPIKENLYYVFYGYLDAKLLVEGLRRGNNSREELIEALEHLENVDIGINTPITYNKNDHQALRRGWWVELEKNEEYKPFYWPKLLQR